MAPKSPIPRINVLLTVLIVLLLLIAFISTYLNRLKEATPNALEPRYMICVPQAGIFDKMNIINKCVQYAKKYDRVVIIDTTEDWFNDDINDYIQIHSPYVYTGRADSITHKISDLSIYPPTINIENLQNITLKIEKQYHYFQNNIDLTIDLKKDYNERVIVYSDLGGGYGPVDLLEISSFSPMVLDVYKSRRKQLPKKYIGIHIRNTDHKSDVPKFIDTYKTALVGHIIFLASDNKNTIDEFKELYGKNVITFANIVDNGGKPIHDGFYRTKMESKEYNIDTFVDILLLASATEYYYSSETSWFSKNVAKLRTNPALVERLTK